MKDKQKDQAVLAAISRLHTDFGVCADDIRRKMAHKIPAQQIERSLTRLVQRRRLEVDQRVFMTKPRRGPSMAALCFAFRRAHYTHYIPV